MKIFNETFKFRDTLNPSQMFCSTNAIHCSRLPLWVGYFINFKFIYMCLFNSLSITTFSSIKETNWLIMCVLLFDVFKHLLLRKTDVLKTCRKSKFLGKKIWRNALALKGKKVHGKFGETFTLSLLSSAVFVYKTVSQISFNLICSGDKRLLLEFLRKWGWFQGHNERFPKYLG